MSFGMIMLRQNMEKKKIMLHGTYNFIFYIKTEDIYADIAKDVKKRLDTLNYELDRPLPK